MATYKSPQQKALEAEQARELADYNSYKKSVKLLEQRQTKAKANLLKLMASKRYDPENPGNEARVNEATRQYNNYLTYVGDRYGDKYDKYVAPVNVKPRAVSKGNPLSFMGKTGYSRPKDLAGISQQISDWDLTRQQGAPADRNSIIADRAKKYGVSYTPPTPPPPRYTPDPNPITNGYYQNQNQNQIYQPTYEPHPYIPGTGDVNYKKGGVIKSPAKTTSKATKNKASSRGDGIAQRGKTRGIMR